MLRLLRRTTTVCVATAASLLIQHAALGAATAAVSIVDFDFHPGTVKVKLGGTVTWTNDGSATHTSSSDGFADGSGINGVNLWHSGSLGSGSSFPFTFVVAGSFPYHCSIHSFMTGTVNIPVKLPMRGTVGRRFRVRWGTADPGTDFTFNVQKANPGGSFQNWKTNVPHTMLSAMYNPTVAGTYQFRAQLVRTSTGQASGFSPAKAISVS